MNRWYTLKEKRFPLNEFVLVSEAHESPSDPDELLFSHIHHQTIVGKFEEIDIRGNPKYVWKYLDPRDYKVTNIQNSWKWNGESAMGQEDIVWRHIIDFSPQKEKMEPVVSRFDLLDIR